MSPFFSPPLIEHANLIAALDSVLPQTQCQQCGFAGCLPYARAIAQEGTAINRCPPGGTAGIVRLAALTGRPVVPLDPECGPERSRQVAHIDPDVCIGCTLCIQACPVDAIAGASKHMHAVLADECTGCRLCLPPCPVDCISMVEPPAALSTWSPTDAAQARERHRRKQARQSPPATSPRPANTTPPSTLDASARKQAMVAAAMQQARARLGDQSDR